MIGSKWLITVFNGLGYQLFIVILIVSYIYSGSVSVLIKIHRFWIYVVQYFGIKAFNMIFYKRFEEKLEKS